MLHDINNRRIIEERDWVSPTRGPCLRRQELNMAIEAIADELGFHLDKMEVVPNGVSITLSTKSKGIDQESELYMGYKSHTNLFKIPMWYEGKGVIDQLTIMLHRLVPYLETQNEVFINVISSDDVSLGSLVTDFCILIGLQLTDTNPETVESIRQFFKTDTLGDYVTFVEKEGAPRFVGTRPVTPNNQIS